MSRLTTAGTKQLVASALFFLGLVAAAGVVLGLVLALSGAEVVVAFAALWRGAFGSTDALLSGTLVRATPLLLAGLGVALAFRAGVWNIGADGQLLAGAAAATAVGLLPGPENAALASFSALFAAAAAGALWAWPATWLKRRFGALEVISTIMLNFLAVQLVSYLVRGPLQEPTGIYPQSSPVSSAVRLPTLGETRLHLGFLVALCCLALAAYLLRATAAGFRLKAVGEGARAAWMVGLIDVEGVQERAFLLSGALAGLAGGIEVTGVTYALYETLSPGYGYTAIAVALLAGLNPSLVLLSGIGLGALAAGGAAMQRDAGVPAGTVGTVEAVLVLLVLAVRALEPARQALWQGAIETGADSSSRTQGH